ncbi:hypothetical protein [Bartonella gabonensis]|uniref:hypothetical protein n=1 Tax=Bartonella gabonensis TaxID=2699889 RepID=UPI00158DCC64|nr:hypothetical protein [Bartonella gabonensis]
MAYKAFSNSGTVWRGLTTRWNSTICMAKSSIGVGSVFNNGFVKFHIFVLKMLKGIHRL